MPVFVAMAVALALVVYAVVYGIARLATRRIAPESRRAVLRVLHGGLLLACALYGYLVWEIMKAHFDTRDFFSPLAERRLDFWSEACRTELQPGTSLVDVLSYIEGQGVESHTEPDRRRRQSYRYTHAEDWLQVEVRDPEVRNWSPVGDLHVYVNVNFEDERVRACTAQIVRHGR